MLRKRACDSCHKKKIQCDGALPACNHCRHHLIDCTFYRKHGREKKKNKKAASRYAISKDLRHRVEQIELALHAAQKNLSAGGTGATTSASSKAGGDGLFDNYANQGLPATPESLSSSSSRTLGLGKLHFAGHLLGGVNSYNGIPFFSKEGQEWIKACTGEEPRFEKLNAVDRSREQLSKTIQQRPTNLGNRSEGIAADLPPRGIVQRLVSAYFESDVYHIFPVIDRLLFQDTIRLAYDANGPLATTASVPSAQGCVFAFMAVASLWLRDCEDLPPIDGSFFETKARGLLPEFILQNNVENLQAILMLSLFHTLHGRTDQILLFHSLACRMAFILGGNYEPGAMNIPDLLDRHRTDKSFRTKTHVRRIFWLLFCLDKEFCLRTGQPPAMDEECCDLSIPDSATNWIKQLESNEDKFDLDLEAEAFSLPILADPLLVKLKSRICRSLYSFSSHSKSDTALLIVVRELDDELERWRESLTPAFRPLMKVVPGSVNPHKDVMRTMHRCMMQFEYLHLLSAIHRASNRCSTWSSAGKSEIQGISSSIDISVRASRSTLVLLQEAKDTLTAQAFWMFVFYPMTAVLNLFCNVLLDPLDPMAERDLQQISQVPDVLQTFQVPLLEENDTSYFDLIRDFVAELVRLGQCAAKRAHLEAGEYMRAE